MKKMKLSPPIAMPLPLGTPAQAKPEHLLHSYRRSSQVAKEIRHSLSTVYSWNQMYRTMGPGGSVAAALLMRLEGMAEVWGELHFHTPNYGILTNSYPILHFHTPMGYEFVRYH